MMTPGLHRVTSEDAARLVARSLGVDAVTDEPAFQFEALRALVWALTDQRRPVHVLRVVNRAASLLQALAGGPEDPALRARLHEHLDSLGDAGDLVELRGGYWLPAPSRLVDVGANTRMLVGGVPTRVIATGGGLEHRGPFRELRSDAALGVSLPREGLRSWARLPDSPLRQWGDEILAQELTAYTERGDSPFEHYSPGRPEARGAPQFKRWTRVPRERSGVGLARRPRLYGACEYRLVQLDGGRVVRAGGALAPGEPRRLMYALDARSKDPVRGRWEVMGCIASVTLSSELPRAEQRIFAAVGRLAIPRDKPYQRIWTFASAHDVVLERLRALEIEVIVPSGGGRGT